MPDLLERFNECRHVTGSVIINLDEQDDLINDDFEFLSHLESIGGVLSFKNLVLMEQIVIPNLQRIEGNDLIPGTNASLWVSNVSGGDIIFPNLTRISRGDAYFNITNDMCGYHGIDWTVILVNGRLVNKSPTDCNSKYIGISTQAYILLSPVIIMVSRYNKLVIRILIAFNMILILLPQHNVMRYCVCV